MTAKKILVIGDVSGHLGELERAVGEHGDVTEGVLADGVCVIQVGDLIHKGPDSHAIIDAVERFRANDALWYQLVGNHEAHHLGGPRFWGVEIDDVHRRVLHDWWDSGWMRVAAAIEEVDGTAWLCTHAGLTKGYWERIGADPDVARVAAHLNELGRGRDPRVLQAGWMLSGQRASVATPPVWAEAGRELVTSWADTTPPFNQLHGHTSAWNWYKGKLGHPGVAAVADDIFVDRERHHVDICIKGRRIVGIDPGNSRAVWRTLCAFELGGTVSV